MRLFAFPLLLLSAKVTPLPPPRVIPAPTLAEPYEPLSGGDFTGPAIPFHPDPLATYVWGPSINTSALQIFALLPASATLTPDTAAASFSNVSSLLTPAPFVMVAGAGGIQLDFGVNSAAWLEFDSPDLSPEDAARVELSVSEYNEVEVTGLGTKVGVPVAHARGAGGNMFRLEIPHPDGSGLYEGVRFAWLRVNATPASQWTITGLRLVCQVKPQNWVGSFAAAADEDLSRIWYLGAYTVKVNLLSDHIGSILIYRGDRYSWTGDAHVAQATAMAALGNFDFVQQNLRYTRDNCNGIESYCLYYVLSVADYFLATNDTTLMAELAAAVALKLEHAKAVWGTQVKLHFYGWDDRLGGRYPGNEAQAAYRFLAMRAWRAWAGVLAATGDAAGAAHWLAYYDAAVNVTRAAGPDWAASLGLFASADAINAGFVQPSEAAGLVSRLFNNSVTICGLSPFNSYFVLLALASVGELDAGLDVVHECWGVMLRLGATTTWEIAKPYWLNLINPNDNLPGFVGYTSEAHPWSSGATAWATAYLAGVRPLLPGFAVYEIAPHIGRGMRGVEARVPVGPGGVITVHVVGPRVCVGVPASLSGSNGSLRMSQVLAERTVGVPGGQGVLAAASFSPGQGEGCSCAEGGSTGIDEASPLVFEAGVGPVAGATGGRSGVATLPLRAGSGCYRVALLSPAAAPAAAPRISTARAPADKSVRLFPAPDYPANFLGRDEITSGSWLGTYGSAGYYFVAFDGVNNATMAALPPWVTSVEQTIDPADSAPWLSPLPGADPRALVDPRNASAPRRVGQYSTRTKTPTFAVDVAVTPATPGATHQFAFYFVDFDRLGRRQTVQLMDGVTLEDISPPVLVGPPDFVGGVWLVWQYPRSVRLRVNEVREGGTLSAIAFDTVST